jgi:conjugative transfer signal peptidase TraF
MKRAPLIICGAAGLAVATLATAFMAGLRVNTTASMPLGIWRVLPPDMPIERGQIVSVCLPSAEASFALARGYIGAGACPPHAEPLLKPVVAIAGDLVEVSPLGISVNGREIAATALRPTDSAGRTLAAIQTGTYSVALGQVWLASSHDPRSFDSRYFGPVPTANVLGVARPLLVRP